MLGKRPAGVPDSISNPADGKGTAAPPAAKAARFIEERVARLSVGANLIEFDGKSCTHEVAWPPGQDGSPLPPAAREGPPARVYPFTIDPFQQVSINCLEAGEFVREGTWVLESFGERLILGLGLTATSRRLVLMG